MILKQKLALILGLLFVVGISADPIIHSFEEEEDEHHHEFHSSADCQVCETESFKAHDLKVNEEYVLVTNISISFVDDQFSLYFANFSARAPPYS
tara:strand:+ start:228 stop:512 length:285 start_codon:yes stop_codon:yes gene_type:complete